MNNDKNNGCIEKEIAACAPVHITFDSSKIEKTYSPRQVEKQLYDDWNNKGYFDAKVDEQKEPFVIVMPPPNITGQLHIGHALDNTLQDILIRWKRMQGFMVLWLPGTDHASIATEAKIVEDISKQGLSKENIGRDEFLNRAWQWKEHFGGEITSQLKMLGCSCDWSRERFTLDDGLSEAVKEFFVKLYKEGLIYRGERIINWCPKCNTSISDAEVEYLPNHSYLWHIKYPIKDSDQFICVATTRPETMLGDVAVAVNPDDSRYTHLIGSNVILPLTGKEIPIIADNYVDKDFGTGAVKITPAHDVNDFEVGLRHNLPVINIMDYNATLNTNAGKYAGLTRENARNKIIQDLEAEGFLLGREQYDNNVGTCYRCKELVEPIASEQWFVRMEQLAKPAIEAIKNRQVQFVPERFAKVYLHWMENIRDWCISRQLWWGHRIPAYYCLDCGELMIAYQKPSKCTKCSGINIEQDSDTLDTWFSSALWPFSTLGWPEKTQDLQYFYPTSVLVTGYDIIFFWVARMIFAGIKNMEEVPFKYVFIHGLIRDPQGRKMSKSLGNGIDPIEIIKNYGADALRFGLISGTAAGNDIRFSYDKIDAGRNFTNKIWNAARFILMNTDKEIDFSKVDMQKFTVVDKWILSKLNALVYQVTNNMQKFELWIALQKVYEFIWEEFCDWYIEMVKPRLYDRESESRLEGIFVLNYVMKTAMQLLHPYMPFITEKVFTSMIVQESSVMISKWPEHCSKMDFKPDEDKVNIIISIIKAIRNIRAEADVPLSKKAKLIFIISSTQKQDLIEQNEKLFERLAFGESISVVSNKDELPSHCISAIVGDIEVYIPIYELIDIEKELTRLEKDKEKLEGELEFVNKKLLNTGFMSKAPETVINEFKSKLSKYKQNYDKVIERLKFLRERN